VPERHQLDSISIHGQITVSLVLLGSLAVFCFISAVYCAWLSATPLTPGRLHQVQFEFFVWLAVAAVTFVLSVIIVFRMIRFRRASHRPEATRAA